ncbi:MAG: hypothetical protein ABUL64_00700, partial [Singulisphaera sp.]
KKISGPLLDRIDLQVELNRLSTEERFAATTTDESPRLRAIVAQARKRQQDRFADQNIPFNAAIPGGAVREFCRLSDSATEHYKQLIDVNTLSTRSMDRLAKVARTIADLAKSETVEPVHVDKAASFVVGGMLRAG